MGTSTPSTAVTHLVTSAAGEGLCKQLHATLDQVVEQYAKQVSASPAIHLADQRLLVINQQDLTDVIKAAIVEVIGAQQEVFDRKEAAAFLRIDASTLDKLRERGLIHPNIATRKPLYSREELLRFMRENASNIS